MGRDGWITGVYIIQSISHPDRVYIGSGEHISRRWRYHLDHLRLNKHHSQKLQRHYNKYGEDDLVFEVLESGDYINVNHLLAREQGWMYHFKNNGSEIAYFNTSPTAGSPLGVKRSEEFCRKLGENKKGNKNVKGKHLIKSPEAIEKMRNTLLKFYQTEEGKLKKKEVGEKLKGKKKPPGMGEKLSKAISGKNHHQFGKPLPLETRIKIGIAGIGRVQSEETKQKRAESVARTKRNKVISQILNSLLINKDNG